MLGEIWKGGGGGAIHFGMFAAKTCSTVLYDTGIGMGCRTFDTRNIITADYFLLCTCMVGMEWSWNIDDEWAS